MRRRTCHLLGPLALVLLVGAGAPSAGDGPRELIQRTVDEVIAILQDPGLDLAERRRSIEAIAYERFHFETMSRLVLARRWRSFSEPQQQEFMEQFRELLSRSYGERINRYEQESVEILKERPEARGDVTIVTRIVGGSADGVEIQYRLRSQDGRWGVIDVVVEGVSLVSNYRSQFAELLGNGSPEDLLKRLREKNAVSPEGTASAASAS